MERRMVVVMLAVASVMLCGSAVAANITIPDESFTTAGWYGAQEDEEVEPGCMTGQAWDLEGFFLDGTTLTMAGGYDFINGISGVTSGDIFFDVTGDAQYGTGAHSPANYNPSEIVADTFGYDFVLDMNLSAGSFSIYDISNGALLETVTEQINDAANPWKLSSGGTLVGQGQFAYQTGVDDAQAAALGYDVVGGLHNLLSVDLTWLLPYLGDTGFTVHFAEACGNDNLMGHACSPVPEPSTIVLLGLGLFGMTLRKRFAA